MIYGAVPPITVILLRVLCYYVVRNQRDNNVWCKKGNPIRLFNRLEALCNIDLCANLTVTVPLFTGLHNTAPANLFRVVW